MTIQIDKAYEVISCPFFSSGRFKSHFAGFPFTQINYSNYIAKVIEFILKYMIDIFRVVRVSTAHIVRLRVYAVVKFWYAGASFYKNWGYFMHNV